MRSRSFGNDIGPKLVGFFAALLFAFPLFSLQGGVFLVMIFALVVLINAVGNRQQDAASIPKISMMVVLFLFFTLYLKDVILAEDTQKVWRIAERKLGLVIIPFLFLLASTRAKFEFAIAPNLVFMASMTSLCLFTWIFVWLEGVDPEHLRSGGWAFALRTKMEDVSGLHPTYFGMFLVYALMERVESWLNGKNHSLSRYLWWSSVVVMTGTLIMLAARAALLAFIISFVVVVLRAALSIRKKAMILGVVVLLALISTAMVPSLNSRVQELGNSFRTGQGERMVIWNTAIDVIKGNLPFGVGVEELQPALSAGYMVHQDLGALLAQKNMNTHNEYLNALATHGILGIFLLIALLVLFWKNGNRAEGHLPAVIIISVLFLTENILDRQAGVFFVSIMIGSHTMVGKSRLLV